MVSDEIELSNVNLPTEMLRSNDIFCIKNGSVSSIVRVHLPRSVKSVVTAGSITPFEVCFTSEFNDPADISKVSPRLMAVFIKCRNHSPTASEICQACLAAFEVALITFTKKSSHFNIKFPEDIDSYRLYLFLHQDSPSHEATITLPLLTDSFNVVSEHFMTLQKNITPLLSCFRFVDGVIVEEEYGRTMGSHIYDCSVAILRYLKMLHTMDSSIISQGTPCKGTQRKVAVELGAGCGLVSIWLSKQNYIGRIIATDVSCQSPLLLRNITNNKAEDNCSAKTLDWSLFSEKSSQVDGIEKIDTHLFDASEEFVTDEKVTSSPMVRDVLDSSSSNRLKLQQHHLGINDGENLDMILAGDVLYSKSLANDFFAVIKTFAIPNETVIIVAQKLRNLDDKDTLNVRGIPGLLCDVVWEEAKVIIWKILVIP